MDGILLSEISAMLKGHCVLGLRGERAAILGMRAHGVPVRALMTFFSRSESGVRAELQIAGAMIFGPFGLNDDPYLTGLWLGYHESCCAETAFSAVENIVVNTEGCVSKTH